MTLTREEIMALEPAELGPVVAEHIFQAKVIGKENFPELSLLIGWFGKEAWNPMKGNWHNAEWRTSEERAWLDCPRFGEDISAAWEVLERMQGSGWSWDMKMNNLANEVEVRIGRGKAVSKIVPEAICKSALIANLDAIEWATDV